MDKIAVLIPCYNEERTVEKVVADFQRALPEAVVYVYNNNSTDHTAELAEKAGAVVRNEYKQGKGNVIRSMFQDIDAACYIMADGDDTYPAEAARELADLGDRLSSTYYTQNKRPFHNFGNALVRWGINLLFDNDIKDIMTGFRAFSYEFVKTFPVLSQGFEIETEMSIHAVDKNMQIENVVIDYRDRPEGSVSKLNTYSDGFKVIRTIFRLYRSYHPLGFFGIIALLLAILSLLFFVPIVGEYVHTGLVDRFPTLIVCGFTMIAAIQSLFTGLTLDTLRKKDRQDFEMELLRAKGEKRKKLSEA